MYLNPFFHHKYSTYQINKLTNKKLHIILVSWCCMCKEAGESIDHLFLHFPVASEMWATMFNLFGLTWVMPRQGRLGRLLQHCHIVIWNAIPHCLI